MIINEKLTGSDNFSSRNFLHSGIVNTPLTDVSLRSLLERVWTILGPVTRLVAIPTRLVGWRNIGTALPRSILGKSNSISLAKTSFSLILLLRWAIPDVCCRWAMLSLGHHRSFRLGSTSLISPFVAFGSSINIIIVLLSYSITDKLIESGALAIAHGFHQLRGKSPLETSNLLGNGVHLAGRQKRGGGATARARRRRLLRRNGEHR
jgi:hypothetical protein